MPFYTALDGLGGFEVVEAELRPYRRHVPLHAPLGCAAHLLLGLASVALALVILALWADVVAS